MKHFFGSLILLIGVSTESFAQQCPIQDLAIKVEFNLREAIGEELRVLGIPWNAASLQMSWIGTTLYATLKAGGGNVPIKVVNNSLKSDLTIRTYESIREYTDKYGEVYRKTCTSHVSLPFLLLNETNGATIGSREVWFFEESEI